MNPNKNPNIFAPKDTILKTCDVCDYICSKTSDWGRHLTTRKHKALTNPNNECSENAPIAPQLYTCKCGKSYKHRSTLSHHKKQCSQTHHSIDISNNGPVSVINHDYKSHSQVDDHSQTNLILELVRQNQEFKQLLIEQNKTIIEVAKNSQVNNTISNSNNNNKTFNLNVFLNEACKDAMNMKDFIK